MGDTIATLGIKIDSKDIKVLNKELEKVVSTAENVEKATSKIGTSLSKFTVESKKNAESESKRTAAINEITRALAIQQIKTKDGIEGITRYNLALLGASETQKKMASDIISGTEAIKRSRSEEALQVKNNLASFKSAMSEKASASKKAEDAEKSRASSINTIISALAKEEQALSMSKDDLIKYNLALLGASESEKKAAQEILNRMSAVKAAQKAEQENARILKEKTSIQAEALKSDQKRKESINDIILKLRDEAATTGKSKSELTAYKLSLLGASDAEKKEAQELIKRTQALHEANSATNKHGDALNSLVSRLSALGATYFGFQALKGFASDLLETAKIADSYKFSLQAVSKSNEEASETFDYLTKESERLGLSLISQEKAFTGFAAAAKQSGMKVEETRSVYTGLMEAMTAMHRTPEEAAQALKAFQDMLSKGTIQAEELKKQLGNSLPGAMAYMADATGKTTQDLMKMMEKGVLPAKEGVMILSDYLSNKFQVSAENASNSVQSSINKMENAWFFLKKAIVDAMGDNTTGIIRDATSTIKKFTDQLQSEEGKQAIKDLADKIKDATTGALALVSALAEILKYAGLKSVSGTFIDGLKQSEQGYLDVQSFVNAGFMDRQKMLEESQKKQSDHTKEVISNLSKEENQWNSLFVETIKTTGGIEKGIKRVSDAQVEANKKAFAEKGASEGQAEAIQKIIDKIEKKSVVAGMSSEQGLIAQLKEAGASKEVIAAQQKIIDGIEAKDKAYKDSIKGQKEVESEKKKRVKFIEDYISKLEQEADTYKKGKEFTADYVLGLKDATAAQKQRAKVAGAFIDAAKKQDAAEKKNKKNLEDYAALMKKVMPEFERNELSRQQALELTATIFKDKLTPAMMGTAAALHLFDEQSEAIKNINEYFDTKEIDDFTKKTDELKDKLKFEGTSFGNEIADGINNAIISMQKFNEQLDKQTKYQKDIDKLEKEIKATDNLDLRAKKQKEMDDLTQEGIKGQLSAYRQLFGTTSQLFKENSKERKVLHNLEMAFAAAEIAMNLQKTISAAYTAIMIQGTGGEPYSAFGRIAAMTALAGGIVAAAGGSLGGGGSGSAPTAVSGTYQSTALGSTEQSQSISNSFSFLEDIESDQYNELKDISSSMKDLNKNITGLFTSIVRTGGISEFPGVEGISGGPSMVQKIAAGAVAATSITSFNAAITKNIPLIGGISESIADFVGGIASSFSNAIWGGSKKTSILASGLQVAPGTIGEILGGEDVSTQAFADIKIKKSGGWFGKNRTYFKTLTEDVDQSVSDMMTLVVKNMGQSMVDIAKGLGTDNLEEVFNYVFDISKIDLKGLSNEDMDNALQEAFSTTSDKAVSDLFGQLIGQYQKVGEGIFETAVRLVGEKAVVLDVLELTNQGFIDSNIPAKALEVTQALIDIAGGLDNLTDAASTYYDKFFNDNEKQARLYGQLTESFEGLNLKLPSTREGYRKLVEGLDLSTTSGQKTYVALLKLSEGADKYYTTIEEGNKKTSNATKAEMELSNARKEAIKKTERSLTVELLNAQGRSAEALALSRQLELESMDESLRPMKLRIWQLQDEAAAADLAAKKEKELADSIEDAAKARKSELETLIKNTVQAQIDSYQELANAANDALSKAEGLLNRSFEAEKKRITTIHESIIEGLTKNLDDAKLSADELRSAFEGLGAAKKAMTLAGTEQITYTNAQSQLFSALGFARQGNFSGAKAVAADTSTLTQDTRGFYSSFEDYQREFFKTKNAITELEGLTSDELSVQETMVSILEQQIALENNHFDKQITTLDEQLDGILGVDNSVVTLTEAITQYQEAQYAADGANTLLKKQTDYLNNMMNTLFDTNSKTGNLVTLIDEYTHPEKYPAQTNVTTTTSSEDQKATNEDLIRQIKILTETVERGNYAIAKNTQATAKTVDKIYVDGAGTL